MTLSPDSVGSVAIVAQTDGAELTLLILPLKKSTIDGTADPECAAAPPTTIIPLFAGAGVGGVNGVVEVGA